MAREAPPDLREVLHAAKPPAEEWMTTPAAPLKKYPYRPHLQGGTVTMSVDGSRIYALLRDEATMVVLDATSLALLQTIEVCETPEQVAVANGDTAYVTCAADRVIAVDARGQQTKEVAVTGQPHGIAIGPRGGVVVVTTRDGRAHAFDAALRPMWRSELAAEPRGVAIDAGGTRAVVAHLRGGTLSVIDLSHGGRGGAPLPNLRDGWPSELFEDAVTPTTRRVAGGAFAVAASPGGTRVFAPYVLKNDGAEIEDFIPGCYANGADLPVVASIAALDVTSARVQRPAPLPLSSESAALADFQQIDELGRLGVVRAAFHDPAQSRLFAVGEGSRKMIAFDTSKADPTSRPVSYWLLPGQANGVVIEPSGARAFVNLDGSRELAVFELNSGEDEAVATIALAATPDAKAVRRGRELFYAANDHRLTNFTGMSCATCHFEGKSDGVTWRLDGKPLQTPTLMGRSFPNALRWHGDSDTLEEAVSEAITRLGGAGLEEDDQAALVAFLRDRDASEQAAAVAAEVHPGAAVFAEAGCDACHDPASDYSDGLKHDFRGGSYRTPSLRGVGETAPYFHDGSAPSLRALLTAHEEGNPMAVGHRLTGRELADLEAFLRTL